VKLYLDTSALVKLYVDEDGSLAVRRAVERADLIATSAIAYVEARSAFVRRRHEGGLSSAGYRRIVRDLDADWDRYWVLGVSDALVREGARLAEAHRLRAFDAVHLASATAVRAEGGDGCLFACWDSTLQRAAEREGLVALGAADRAASGSR
jgi:predicted nucleic acid-binding protein